MFIRKKFVFLWQEHGLMCRDGFFFWGGGYHISYLLAYVSNPQTVGIIGWRKSGCVSLLNNCGPHRHLRTFFLKTKVVSFEILILKSVNKLKLDNFWPSYDPSKEACFFHFLNSPKEIRSRLFIKRLWASQTSENFFTKQKLFLFKF